MKKRTSLFLILLIIVASACAVHISAWSGGVEVIAFGATSDDGGYEPAMAFDDNADSFWHSRWTGDGYTAMDDFPQTMIAELDGVYTIDCAGYLARRDSSANGTALAVEVWVSTSGSVSDAASDAGWTKVAEAEWDEEFWYEWKINGDDTGEFAFQNLEFDPVEAKLVKLKIMDGVGGWASCAAFELGFLGVDYDPMYGFIPKSAPGTPVPVTSVDDGGVSAPADTMTEAPTAIQVQVRDNSAVVTFSIIFLTAACLIAYAVIFNRGENHGGKQSDRK